MAKVVWASGIRNDRLFKTLLKKPLKDFLSIPGLLIRVFQSNSQWFTINEKTKSRSTDDKKNLTLMETLQQLYKPSRDIYITFNNTRPQDDQVCIAYYPHELKKLLK